tara:strand:+ start:963 stop:1466 length:504 start_codon:yes stop_codon:yes gene_type:complete
METVVRSGNEIYSRIHYFPALVLWNPYNVTMPAKEIYFIMTGTDNNTFAKLDSATREILPKNEYARFNQWHLRTSRIKKGKDNSNMDDGYCVDIREFGGEGKGGHPLEYLIKCPDIPPGRCFVFTPNVSSPYDLGNYKNNMLEPSYRKEKNFILIVKKFGSKRQRGL